MSYCTTEASQPLVASQNFCQCTSYLNTNNLDFISARKSSDFDLLIGNTSGFENPPAGNSAATPLKPTSKQSKKHNYQIFHLHYLFQKSPHTINANSRFSFLLTHTFGFLVRSLTQKREDLAGLSARVPPRAPPIALELQGFACWYISFHV